MSDDIEKKSIKFKTITQEIKFRGTSNSRTKIKTEIEELKIPSNELDRLSDEKIPLLSGKDNPKLFLDENLQKDISILENNNKMLINTGNDSQSLTRENVETLNNEQINKDNKSLYLPLVKRKKYTPKSETVTSSDVTFDHSKKFNKTTKIISNDLSNLEEKIIRHSYSSNNEKSKSTWGQSSFSKKKTTPKKNEQVLEEESNDIYRTSTLKKPKRKPKEIVDDDGYVRSSKKPVKQYATKSKKEYIYNEEKLYNYGINRLSEQDYGRHELFKKMKNLQEDEEIINKVLDKLEGQKYLSDNNRIRSFLMSYSNSESVNKTKQRLIQKGFNKKIIEDVLEEMEHSGIYKAIQDKESEEEKALALLIRRYRIYEIDKKEKMSRFLASKGFNFDIISKVMKTFSNGDFDSFDPY